MAKQMPLRHQLGQGVERCGGLIITFLFLFLFCCQKTGTSSMLVFLSFLAAFSHPRSWRFKNCPAVNKLIVFRIQIQIQLLILKKCSWKRIIGAILKMSQNGLAIIAFGRSLNSCQKTCFQIQLPGCIQLSPLLILQLC